MSLELRYHPDKAVILRCVVCAEGSASAPANVDPSLAGRRRLPLRMTSMLAMAKILPLKE